jgi:hypothetical protein
MPRRPRRSAGGVYDRHSLRTRSSTNAAKAPGLERQPIRHSESRAATALAQRGLRCVGCPSLLDVTRSTSPTSSPAHGLWPDCRRSGLGAPHSEALAGPARRAVRPWPRRQRSVVIYRRRASSLQPGDIRPQDASAGADVTRGSGDGRRLQRAGERNGRPRGDRGGDPKKATAPGVARRSDPAAPMAWIGAVVVRDTAAAAFRRKEQSPARGCRVPLRMESASGLPSGRGALRGARRWPSRSSARGRPAGARRGGHPTAGASARW